MFTSLKCRKCLKTYSITNNAVKQANNNFRKSLRFYFTLQIKGTKKKTETINYSVLTQIKPA